MGGRPAFFQHDAAQSPAVVFEQRPLYVIDEVLE
jgi:hypothetical protein